MIRVLLVDDSPVMRLYVSRALKMIGLEITIYEAENGRDAIGRFEFSRTSSLRI